MVPAAELGLGVLVLLAVSRSRHRLTSGVTAASMIMLVSFTLYLLMVPESVAASAGCGCHGARVEPLIQSLGVSTRGFGLLRNAGLLAVHLPLWRVRNPPA